MMLSQNIRLINLMEPEDKKKYLRFCEKFIGHPYVVRKKGFKVFCNEIGYISDDNSK